MPGSTRRPIPASRRSICPPANNRVIAVPAGSILNLRAHGAAHAPGVTIGDMHPPRFAGVAGEYSATAKLTHDGRVRVQASGHRIGLWNLHVIADAAAGHRLSPRGPRSTERRAIKFAFKASDDYAVTSAKVVIRPHGKPGAPIAAGSAAGARQDGGAGQLFRSDRPSLCRADGGCASGGARWRRPDRREQDHNLPPAGAGLHRSPGARPDRATPGAGDQRQAAKPAAPLPKC